jgi:voltage-gated potassium channel
LKSVGYELFMVFTSALSIINFTLIALAMLRPEAPGPGTQVVWLMELTLTPVFLADFVYRLLTAPSRRLYFFRRAGWADLIAVVPTLRLFRLFRIAGVIRALRRQDGDDILTELSETRASTTFLITIFLVFVVVETAGATIYSAESPDPAANIKTAGDAIWWGLVTITTVGYGDFYPVTTAGRVIGVFLLFAGIALFSVLTGFIANVFLAPRRRRWLRRPADEKAAAIEDMRRLLAEQDDRSALIRARLDELERTIASSRKTDAGTTDQAG